MIIVDNALKKREAEGKPVQTAVVGAGYIGRGIVMQIERYLPGMRCAAVSNRTISKAFQAYEEAGTENSRQVRTKQEVEAAVDAGVPVVVNDPSLLCAARNIDVVIEATGDIELGARVILDTIDAGKHIVLMNAEIDALIGPLLKIHADRKKVVYTNTDGDQPGAIMNLYRFVESIGFKPLLCGNIKGLQDAYRTPQTQFNFARKHGLSPEMATSFADGTKISIEMALVSNATGMPTGKRGMYGPRCNHVNQAKDLFPMEQMMNGGIVDYILGAEPGPGVFVLGYNEEPIRRDYMRYFKMGEGPVYVFYTPYHLPPMECPLTAARAVLFQDAAIAPQGRPVSDVITIAKRNLKRGEKLDGIGGFTCYGMLENYDISIKENLLPMGLSRDCVLKNDVPQDQALTYDDIVLPHEKLSTKLRVEMDRMFFHSNADKEAILQ